MADPSALPVGLGLPARAQRITTDYEIARHCHAMRRDVMSDASAPRVLSWNDAQTMPAVLTGTRRRRGGRTADRLRFDRGCAGESSPSECADHAAASCARRAHTRLSGPDTTATPPAPPALPAIRASSAVGRRSCRSDAPQISASCPTNPGVHLSRARRIPVATRSGGCDVAGAETMADAGPGRTLYRPGQPASAELHGTPVSERPADEVISCRLGRLEPLVDARKSASEPG